MKYIYIYIYTCICHFNKGIDNKRIYVIAIRKIDIPIIIFTWKELTGIFCFCSFNLIFLCFCRGEYTNRCLKYVWWASYCLLVLYKCGEINMNLLKFLNVHVGQILGKDLQLGLISWLPEWLFEIYSQYHQKYYCSAASSTAH